MLLRVFTHREEAIISARVFVGNLSYTTTQTQVESLFSEIGDVVEVFLPTDRMSGRPRGFAFVELTEEAAAAEAIEKLNGSDLDGRTIRVTEAEARPPRAPRFDSAPGGGPPRGGGGGGGGGHGGHGGHGQKKFKAKGSRRNLRGKKRSL